MEHSPTSATGTAWERTSMAPTQTAGWLSCLRSLTSNVVLQSHVRALSTSLVAVCDVILDAGTSDFACHLTTLDEHDRLAERRPARMGITHRDVLEPDRHATEEDELVRG